MGNLLSNGGV